MINYQDAAKGLRKRYIGEIGIMVSVIFLLMPSLYILAALVMLVFLIISTVGLYQMGKDIEACKTAFILQMIVVVLTLISIFLPLSGGIGIILALIQKVVPLIVLYLIFYSLIEIMRGLGEEKLAETGVIAMWISLGCSVLGFFSDIIVAESGLLGALVVIVLSIVGVVLELKFYMGCVKRFNTDYIENEHDSETGAEA